MLMMKKKNSYLQFRKELKEVLSLIKKSPSGRTIVCYGDESFLHKEAVDKLKKACLSYDLGWCYYSQAAFPKQLLSDLLQAESLFDTATLYCIQNADKHKNNLKQLSNINKPSQISNPLLLTFKQASVSPSVKKQISHLDPIYINCSSLAANNVLTFVTAFAKDSGLFLTEEACYFLVDYIGPDYLLLENEIKALSLIFSQQIGSVSSSMISPHLSLLKEDHTFKLQDFILQNKEAQAHALVLDLLQRGVSSLAILGVISKICRQTIQVKGYMKAGENTSSISKALKIPSFALRPYTNYSKAISLFRLKEAMARCHEADILFKTTTSLSDDLILGDLLSCLHVSNRSF